MSTQKHSLDEYGFFIHPDTTSSPTTIIKKNMETKWLQIINNWEVNMNYSRRIKIKKLCRIGIPDSLRSQVWALLSKSHHVSVAFQYHELVNSSLSVNNNATFDTIDRDIARYHSMFSVSEGEGQKNIRNMLRAYSILNPAIGYCQGMGMIAGALLMRMQAQNAFELFVCIIDGYLKDYFSPTLGQLVQDAELFQALMNIHAHKLFLHFKKLGVETITFIPKWFLVLFTLTLHWKASLRVWDMFFCDGVKALHRTGIAILLLNQKHILKKLNSAGDVMDFIVNIPKNSISEDELIRTAAGINVKKLDISRMREIIAAKSSKKP